MKPIVISLSPNTFSVDVRLALSLLFQPWRWRNGPEIAALEEALVARSGMPLVSTFDSGRSAWFALLRALGIKAGDEIILQVPTCIVVPNSIRWCGAVPVFADTDAETLNIDVEDLRRKITSRTRGIMVQHNFGVAADLKQIREIAAERGIFLIEDCAHALGGTLTLDGQPNRPLGSFGSAAFFSFGRDKVISSVFGGAAAVNDATVSQDIRNYRHTLPYPSYLWIKQQLLHPILTSLILPVYSTKLGKALLVGLQKARVLSKAVYPAEKKGYRHPSMPKRLPNALAILAWSQLQRLDEFNHRRREIAARYRRELTDPRIIHPRELPGQKPVYLRYTVRIGAATGLIAFAKTRGIYLGDWYNAILAPQGSDLTVAGYLPGSCPNAEQLITQMVNLPTYPRLTEEEVGRVIGVVREWVRRGKVGME